MLRRSFYGPLNMKWDWLTDTTVREAFPLVALGLVILFVGIYPQPIIDLLTPSLQQMVHSVSALAIH
jgi:NADH-quinone oxidoreductase subunit M